MEGKGNETCYLKLCLESKVTFGINGNTLFVFSLLRKNKKKPRHKIRQAGLHPRFYNPITTQIYTHNPFCRLPLAPSCLCPMFSFSFKQKTKGRREREREVIWCRATNRKAMPCFLITGGRSEPAVLAALKDAHIDQRASVTRLAGRLGVNALRLSAPLEGLTPSMPYPAKKKKPHPSMPYPAIKKTHTLLPGR